MSLGCNDYNFYTSPVSTYACFTIYYDLQLEGLVKMSTVYHSSLTARKYEYSTGSTGLVTTSRLQVENNTP
jgi:hypothetical protein